MDILSSIVSHLYNSSRKELLTYAIYFQAGCIVPLAICCFSISGTANAGFNAIFITILNITFVFGAKHLVDNFGSPIAIGFLIGVGCMISAMNFMASIFWGQLSGCKPLLEEVPGYTCTSTSTYTAVSVFSVFLFLCQIAFTGAVSMWRSELIVDEDRKYEGLGQSTHNPMGTASSVDL